MDYFFKKMNRKQKKKCWKMRTIREGMEGYYGRLKLRTLERRSEILYFVRFLERE